MNSKHVFLDWWEIDPGYGVSAEGFFPSDASPYGVKIIAHKPQLDPRPIIPQDKSWESRVLGSYCSVLKVKEKYFAWYEAQSVSGFFGVCYAESDDGINWNKPNLGLIEFEGDKNNNIIRDNWHPAHKIDGYVLIDEGETVIYCEDAPENERFKMIFTRVYHQNDIVVNVCLWGAYSADGIHWTETGPLFKGGDTQSSFFYDKSKKKYVIISKCQNSEHLIRRTQMYSESEDFIHWSEPRIILNGDPNDPPDIDYYTSACHQWKDAKNAYVMFPAIFHRTKDYVHPIIVTSRDLLTYNRPIGLEPLIPMDKKYRSAYPNVGMVEEDGKWYHYISLHVNGHHGGFKDPNVIPEQLGLFRFYFREDGYTSLQSESHGGITTIPLNFGKQLKLNADIQYTGYIKIAITEEKTNIPLKGFSFEDCKLIKIDKNSYEVKWSKPLTYID